MWILLMLMLKIMRKHSFLPLYGHCVFIVRWDRPEKKKKNRKKTISAISSVEIHNYEKDKQI